MSSDEKTRAYYQEKVDPILKPLITEIIQKKPDDVHAFIVDWIEEKSFVFNSNHDPKINIQVIPGAKVDKIPEWGEHSRFD